MTGFEIIIPALIQIPFIAAFIWFAIRMSTDYREDAKERDRHWMEFLTLERAQRKEAMDQGMTEVKIMHESSKQVTMHMVENTKDLTSAMADLARAIAEHNVSAIERFNRLKDIVSNE